MSDKPAAPAHTPEPCPKPIALRELGPVSHYLATLLACRREVHRLSRKPDRASGFLETAARERYRLARGAYFRLKSFGRRNGWLFS